MRTREPVTLCLPGCATHIPTVAGAAAVVNQHLDVIGVAGSSGGGAVALALAAGVPEERLLKMLRSILQDDRALDRSITAAARFGRCSWNVIGDACDEMLGKGFRLGDIPVEMDVIVPVLRADTGRPAFITNRQHPQVLVRELVCATTALVPIACMQYIPSLSDLGAGQLFFDPGFAENLPDHVFDVIPVPRVAVRLGYSQHAERAAGGGLGGVVAPQRRVRPWAFSKAVMALAEALMHAPGELRSKRDDGVVIDIDPVGSGVDFSLSDEEILGRYRHGQRVAEETLRIAGLLG